MEVKGIFGKIHHTEVKKLTPYFALQIEEGLVKSALWVVQNGVVKILSLGETGYWEVEEELLETIDKTISAATENLETNIEIEEPNQVILGLPYSWVNDNKINTSYLEKLRDIFKELDLTPSGFVVTVEALVHYLKANEGIPPTAILMGLREDNLIISLVKLGKIAGVEIVKRSDSLESDLLEGLSRFPQESSFPSRILLYDTDEDLEEVKQRLMSYPWQSAQISFLHLPKIEVLPFDFDIKAVALAGGREIASAQSVQNDYVKKSVMAVEDRSTEEPRDLLTEDPGQEIDETNQPVDSTAPPQELLSPINSSVVIPQTSVNDETDNTDIEPDDIEEIPANEAESLGFITGRDISQITRFSNLPVSPDDFPDNHSHVTFPDNNKAPATAETELTDKFSSLRPQIKLPNLPKINIHFGKFKSIPVIIGLILMILIGLAGAAWWYLPMAKITLKVKSAVLEKEFTVKLDPQLTETKKEQLLLPGESITTTLETSKTQTTTGTKLVGEAAKGEVSIYNRTNSQKKFASGTIISGPNGIKFTLDEDTIVASQSAGTDYSLVPGKATAKVTAAAIGGDGNLASGSEFSVEKYAKSDFIARSNSDFSGGTSREIQAVAKADIDLLRKAATEELKNKALSELSSKIPPERKIIENSLVSKSANENFNHKAGDEADSISLDLKLEFSALAYSRDELQKLIQDEAQKSAPSGYSYNPTSSDFNYEVKNVDKDNVVTVVVKLKTKLAPVIDINAIKHDLIGKDKNIGQQYLQRIINVTNSDIKQLPTLPAPFNTLPRIEKNITIEVVSE